MRYPICLSVAAAKAERPCGKNGIEFSEWATVGGLYGNKLNDNTFVSTENTQRAIILQNFIGVELHPGSFWGNYILSTTATPVMRKVKKNGEMNIEELSLAQWQESEKQATANHYLNVAGSRPVQFYNVVATAQNIDLGKKKYRDIAGTEWKGKFTLQPFVSKVLLPEK